MKKLTLLSLVLAMALALLAGGTAVAGEQIKLGMSTWLGYAPLYLAKEKGFFQKRGVDVDIVVIESPADRRAAFAADRIQGFATTVDTHVMTAAAENPIPVKQVLALDDSHGGDGMVSKKDIATIKDLKGKTVAAQLGAGASYFWLNYVLAQNGLKLSDIQAVDMKAGDAGAAFVAGKVDAAVTWEPWLSRAKGTPFGKVLISSDQTPGIIVDSLAFKPDFLKRRGDDVKKIIAAWFEAVQYAKDNPKDADAIMAKFTNQKPEEFTAEKAGVVFYGEKENKDYFGTPQKPGLLYQVTQRAADLWFELKFIKTKPNAADLVDGSYL
ncbi:MAG TPA: ABC transporter substrate-binding protein [Candidatus Baltobacteraceae bacterium]|nr:ABC transporter substrate-binding protein [Candidatus Baltobacteraceae bacterium]